MRGLHNPYPTPYKWTGYLERWETTLPAEGSLDLPTALWLQGLMLARHLDLGHNAPMDLALALHNPPTRLTEQQPNLVASLGLA